MKTLLSKILGKQKEADFITIVSGLPRSGTSMMMRMLQVGGMPIVMDNIRLADSDNPRGYYEFEKIKKIEEDDFWIDMCRGKAVKMVSALLKHLPPRNSYRIVFMQRDMCEILASQKVMLERRGEVTNNITDQEMARKFEKHLQEVEELLVTQNNIDVTYVKYNDVIKSPYQGAKAISRFLNGIVNPGKMAPVVEKGLHRQRANDA